MFHVGLRRPTDETERERCATDRVALTADYYKGDRSMRESGFDVTFRFGPFGADTHHYAAVCLNSLLYKDGNRSREMAPLLGRTKMPRNGGAKQPSGANKWMKYLWDAKPRSLF